MRHMFAFPMMFQTYAESLLVALLCCVSFGDGNTRIPFVCNALKIWEVRNFPLDFLGQVRNIPRAEFSPAEKTPYRILPPPPYRKGCTTTHTNALEMRAKHACNSYKCITRLIVTCTRHHYAGWAWSCTYFVHGAGTARKTPPPLHISVHLTHGTNSAKKIGSACKMHK